MLATRQTHRVRVRAHGDRLEEMEDLVGVHDAHVALASPAQRRIVLHAGVVVRAFLRANLAALVDEHVVRHEHGAEAGGTGGVALAVEAERGEARRAR